MSTEEDVVEILLKVWDSRDLCIDLWLVNLETGKVRFYGGDKLFGAMALSSMVALGPDIYIVGGDLSDSVKNELRCTPDTFVHSAVSRINVYDFDAGWKNVTPFKTPVMIYENQPFACVTLNNKLYVFGETYGEVYNPEFPNQWVSLPTVLQFPRHWNCIVKFPVLADSKNNRIIVYLPFLHSIYAYYPDQSRWESIVDDFRSSWSVETVLFDGMLLMHNDDFGVMPIKAYDLETKNWLNPIFDPESDTHTNVFEDYQYFDAIIPMEHTPGTFYLALCILNHAWEMDDISDTTLILLKFTFHRSNKSGDPVFKYITTQKFHFNETYLVCNYLPVIGNMSKIKDRLEEEVPKPLTRPLIEKKQSSSNDNVGDCSLKSTAELVKPIEIWTLLKDMKVVDSIACYRFLVKDPISLTTLLGCPIQKRKQILEILMSPN